MIVSNGSQQTKKIKVPLSQYFKSKLLTLTFTESTLEISEELKEGVKSTLVHWTEDGRDGGSLKENHGVVIKIIIIIIGDI